jgi:hypothetical protein
VALQSYTVTLTNTSNAVKAGFQLTALNAANQKMGTLTAGTGCSIGNGGGRQYVRQSSPRTLSNGATSWTFTWKAPETVVDDSIHFYFVSLCANGNGQKTGDNVLVSKKSVVLPPQVSAAHDGIDQSGVRVFPNPAKSTMSMEFPGHSKFKIKSVAGQNVLEGEITHQKNVNVSELESGLYFVIFESGGKTVSKTFIKE